MNRRILLGLAVLIALGGALIWFFGAAGGGGGRGGDVGPDVDDGSTAGDARSPEDATARSTSLANEGRDPRPTTGVGSVIARVVRKSDRLALSGVLVRLARAPAAGDRVDRPSWTDAKGDVRFEDVAAGAGYEVHVQREPNPPVDRTGVVVNAGETTDLGVLALDAVGIVDALVLDERREPVKDAVVSVSFVAEAIAELDASPWPLDAELPGSFAHGVTDDRGRVRLEGVPPGPVAVRATSANLRGRTFRAFVPVEPPQTAFVAFVLSAGTTYAGRVIDGGGAPIAGALVEFGLDRVERFDAHSSTRTADDGTFALRGSLDLVGFSVRAAAEHYAPAIVTPGPWKSITIALGKGASVVVHAFDALTRAPLSGARVTLGVRDQDPRDAHTRPAYEGRTGIDGSAEIEFPAGRALSLRVVEETHRTLEAIRRYGRSLITVGELVGDVESPVASGERRELTALLSLGESLKGWVSDSNHPPAVLAGALVKLRHGERAAAEVTTDREGEFSLPAVFLSDRSPVLVVSARGFDPTEVPVTSGRLTIQLTPTEAPISITGRIVGGDRRPVAGALVRVPERGLVTRTEAEGTFAFTGLRRRLDPRRPAGPITLVAEEGTRRVTLTLPIQERVQFGDILLDTAPDLVGVTLRGTSSDRTHYPLVELVRLRKEGPVVVETLVGGEFGDFTFPGLAAGTYRVRGRDALGGGQTAFIEVERGRARPSFVEVRLNDVWTCAGRLDDRAGRPLEGVVVRLESLPTSNEYDTGLAEGTCVTDESGAFRFRCYGVGPFRIRFAPDPLEPRRELRETVHEGDDNVIRAKLYMKPPTR